MTEQPPWPFNQPGQQPDQGEGPYQGQQPNQGQQFGGPEIGRAAWREKGEISGVAGSLKKKNKKRRLKATVITQRRSVLRHARKRTPGPRFFFFQAEDGIRDTSVTGVQTCALPI